MKYALYLILIVIGFSLLLISSNNLIVRQKEEIQTLNKTNTTLEKHVEYLENALKESRIIDATVTAYSPREDETDTDPLITASMQPVREGTVAVSRDLFYAGWVFGRRVYIEGHGIFIITDLMHERKKQQIDIFRFSTKKAMKFGRKSLRVALLD